MQDADTSKGDIREFYEELQNLSSLSEQVARLSRRAIVYRFRKLGQDPKLAVVQMLMLMNSVERAFKRVRYRMLKLQPTYNHLPRRRKKSQARP